ncbi:MAG: efflux RND transporter periplasmic adaptor subunit [Ethanoligenens sp.]
MKKWIMLLTLTTAIIVWISIWPTASVLAWNSEKVIVVQVHTGEYDTQVQCSGTIQPAAEQAVSFGLPVKPTAIHVAVGDTVHAGQVLMDIDRNQSIAAIASTQSNANNDGSSISDASGSDSGSNSSEETERIQQAINDWVPGAAGTPTVSGSMGALMQQYAQYAGTSETSEIQSALSSQLAQGASNSANSASAESVLEQQIPNQIIAPISGVVTQMNASVGSFSAATDSLVVISDLSALSLRAQVNQSDITQVRDGQNVQITTSGSNTDTGNHYTGTVTQIFPKAHSVSGTSGTQNVVDVLIRIAKQDKYLLPDMNAQAAIITNVNPQTISVPYEAVQQDDAGQEYLFVLRDNCVYRQNIRTGNEFSSTVQVLSGLQSNDKVVFSPSSSLKSGMPVRVEGIRHV